MNGQVRIGKFIITELDDKNIWISIDDGEGGQFSKEAFEKVVAEFYKENF